LMEIKTAPASGKTTSPEAKTALTAALVPPSGSV